MIIILFYSDKRGRGERLLSEIQTKIRGHRIEVDQTVEAFSERFRSPMIDQIIVVLMAESRERLEELISMGDLMNDVPILLVLPDHKPDTISVGHRLYPRFVTYVDSDFSDLVSVLRKLLHRAFQGTFPEQNIYAGLKKHGTISWKRSPGTGSYGAN